MRPSSAALGTLLLTAATAPSPLEHFDVRFLRENLDVSWDRSSLQRLSCRLPTNLSLASSERELL